MNKYSAAKKEIMDFINAFSDSYATDKKYIKDIQKEITNYICYERSTEINAILTPYGTPYYIPIKRKSETMRGYRSRVASWTYLFIVDNLVDRWNNDEQTICNLIYPSDIPNFMIEGVVA